MSTNNDREFQEILGRLDAADGPDQQPAGSPPPLEPPQRSVAVLPLYRPRASWALLVLNVAIFLIPELLGQTGRVQDWGAKDNAAILGGEYYRFLTAMFLHAGLTHLGFNAFAIYSMGVYAERLYGTARFVAIYFLAGIGGGLASYAFSPNPSVGASGAIFGIVGALGVFFYQSRGLFGEISRQQLGSLIFITLINLGIGFTTPRIDNFAHIGGLICGALAALALAQRLEVDRRSSQTLIVRRSNRYGWAGALALLAVLAAAIFLIQPPLR
jgi:rhomboid protease GluP